MKASDRNPDLNKEVKMAKAKRKKSNLLTKVFLIFVLGIFAAGGYMGYQFYRGVIQSNVVVDGAESAYFFISTGSTSDEVITQLIESGYITDRNSFEWWAEFKNYKDNVHPGRYKLQSGMSNDDLIQLLKDGIQEPLKVRLDNIRHKDELSGIVGKHLELDSASLMALLTDEKEAKKYGLTKDNFMTLFIGDTYEFYWNSSAEGFIKKMKSEYDAFWNEERRAKAKELGLSPAQVGILASIVHEETAKAEEKGKIAGVYLNRLKINMPLQADPTIEWALNEFNITRVKFKHLKVDSPYNTYKHKGLPPGPIILPTRSYMDAVLNYEKHDYLYFCAKDDLSGFSNFAKTYQQHLVNARKYHAALDKKNIH